jgi:tetratricopeptide (TPR) repeat protein
MALEDPFGLPLTTSSSTARDWCHRALDQIWSADGEAEASLSKAIEVDPDFALAHFLLGRERQTAGNAPLAAASFARARDGIARCSNREKRHVDVMMRLFSGAPDAPSVASQYLDEFPRDLVVVLQMVVFLFWRGGKGKREASDAFVRRFRPVYGGDWRFAGIHANTLWDAREYGEAERMARIALDARGSRNGFALHCLTHVYHGTRDYAQGAQFLSEHLPHYCGWLDHHLWWHRAMFQVERGDTRAVAAWFDEHVKPAPQRPTAFLQFADATQLLWRCRLHGVEEPRLSIDETHALATRFSDAAASGAGPPPLTFVEAHAAMTFALAGDRDRLARHLARLRAAAEQSRTSASLADVASGVAAFAEGRWASAIELLEPCVRERRETEYLGGSNVEQEIFCETLTEAYLRAGRPRDAAQWVQERIRDDGATPRRRLWLARALTAAGDLAEARAEWPAAAGAWDGAAAGAPERRMLDQLRRDLALAS